jgi:hypothetical protein
MTYDELLLELKNARLVSARSAPVLKSLPSSAGLSTRNATLVSGIVKGIAPEIDAHVRREVEKAVAPLKAEIAQLKTLTDSLLRPPCVHERRATVTPVVPTLSKIPPTIIGGNDKAGSIAAGRCKLRRALRGGSCQRRNPAARSWRD